MHSSPRQSGLLISGRFRGLLHVFPGFFSLVISPIEDTSASHGVHHQTARRTYNTRRGLCLSVLLQMRAGRGPGQGG